MFVSEIMTRCVAECTEDLGLEEVYQLIRKCDHGLVVVVDSHAHRVPIGVVTERSICEQIIVRGRTPKNLFAGAVMDARIRTVVADDLVTSLDLEDDVTAIVVTDSKRQVCGLILPADLMAIRASPDIAPNDSKAMGAVSEIPAFGWVQ